MKVNAYASSSAGASLEKFQYELPEIGEEQIDIKVHFCGVCHSDLSMINNEWGMTTFPFVPGHEIVGEVEAIGKSVKNFKVGDKVGLGWFAGSCMHCDQCMSGKQNLCSNTEQTIINNHGGFADYVRSHWSGTIKLPQGLDLSKSGPLLCGGVTVFNPIMKHVKPTDKVGVIGVGGLGHMAIKFLKAWGCEVIAFSSNPSKKEEVMKMGATKVVNSKDPKELENITGQLNVIISTVNVKLDWNSYINVLAPQGRLHTLGAVTDPLDISAFPLLFGEKSIGGSPTGDPVMIKKMLEFCVRHNIYPTVEMFDMEDVNKAMEHLHDGKARYRIVLKA